MKSVFLIAPVLAAATVQPLKAQSASTTPAPQYRISGDRSLRPSEIRDDGAKTYLNWPAATELPAIFAVDEQGREVMIDVWMRNGQLVIDSVPDRLVFRLDRQSARAERKRRRP